MLDNGFIDEEMYALAVSEKLELRSAARPFDAPHFTQLLQPLLPQESKDIFSTLDRDLQLYAEQVVKNYIVRLTEQNVTNGAVVVLENATGAVLAYVGSADFYNTQNSGQVDGARAFRQPGSALKPFVYGLALERGNLTPASLLADEDTFFEGDLDPAIMTKIITVLFPCAARWRVRTIFLRLRRRKSPAHLIYWLFCAGRGLNL